MIDRFRIVPFSVSEGNFAVLTRLLHACYASLLEQGFEFTATRQSVDTTRARTASGECWIGLDGEEWAGTVTWYRPDPNHQVVAYRDPKVAHFGQLGVLPNVRGRGLGKALVDHVGNRAKVSGFSRLALDTAAPATGLLDLYARWGFEIVGEHDWRPGVNYPSLVLAKTL